MLKMNILALVLPAGLIFLFSCSGSRVRPVEEKRDTTITAINSYSELFLDSSDVAHYIISGKVEDSIANRIRNFYNRRNYQYAWFTQDGLAEHALAFWNLHQQYYVSKSDSSLIDRKLHRQMDQLVAMDTVIHPGGLVAMETELALTHHFFEFARYNYTARLDPSELQWHIPRKRINAVDLLDSLVRSKGNDIRNWEPMNRRYQSMHEAIRKFHTIEKNGGWKQVEWKGNKAYREGNADPVIRQIKQRLAASGDFPSSDTSEKFTPELTLAVKQAQKRFGFTPDGLINGALVKQLNVPVEKRIEQLLINMERMRWMPAAPDGLLIIANIPEFRLHVINERKREFSMDIVVGKAGNNTVIFTDELKYVVFSPYWNVPRSIVRNEILPAMQKNPGYLARNNMEQTGFSNGLPVIRQKPGPGNALGKVKFIFPNNYNIYFHDTPAKSLFERDKRAFSHGCIRLQDARKLAMYLLKDEKGWTEEKIDAAMNARREKWVQLDKNIPVMVTYFTSWVDAEGLVHFREDIYGHDKKVAARLFQLTASR